MTPPEPDRDESELRILFEQSADMPDAMQLTKLKARAADVPSRTQRRPWWMWAPLAAIGAGALLVVLARSNAPVMVAKSAAPPNQLESAPVAQSIEPSPSPTAAPSPDPSELALQDPTEPEADSAEAELLEVVGEDPLADDSLGNDAFAVLDEPADEDVDAWLAATSAFLEDG